MLSDQIIKPKNEKEIKWGGGGGGGEGEVRERKKTLEMTGCF